MIGCKQQVPTADRWIEQVRSQRLSLSECDGRPHSGPACPAELRDQLRYSRSSAPLWPATWPGS